MKYIPHLLQSELWAKFRKAWRTKVVTAGKAQFTVHNVPYLPWTIGYMPRVFPQDIDWKELAQKAKDEKCIFVKIEPNSETFEAPKEYTVLNGERIFAHATYLIDLKKSEQELLLAMHPKTRYNIKVAKRNGIVVKIGYSEKLLGEFLDLFHQTEKRQRFFNHPNAYYQLLFDTFKKENAVEIVIGYYNGMPLASMMVFFYGGNMFYPYGGSTLFHKEKMPFYLVMWEAIRLGRERNCRYFDLWNCLTPEQENPKHPWYGFHRFKKGFGGELIRFCGAYDVVFEPFLYPIVVFLNKTRWAFLKMGVFLKKRVRP